MESSRAGGELLPGGVASCPSPLCRYPAWRPLTDSPWRRSYARARTCGRIVHAMLARVCRAASGRGGGGPLRVGEAAGCGRRWQAPLITTPQARHTRPWGSEERTDIRTLASWSAGHGRDSVVRRAGPSTTEVAGQYTRSPGVLLAPPKMLQGPWRSR